MQIVTHELNVNGKVMGCVAVMFQSIHNSMYDEVTMAENFVNFFFSHCQH